MINKTIAPKKNRKSATSIKPVWLKRTFVVLIYTIQSAFYKIEYCFLFRKIKFSSILFFTARSLWRNCESGCLCLSARWCLVSFAHSQPCLSFISNVLYRRVSDRWRGQWTVKRSVTGEEVGEHIHIYKYWEKR
jgi:hypothetical protein